MGSFWYQLKTMLNTNINLEMLKEFLSFSPFLPREEAGHVFLLLLF